MEIRLLGPFELRIDGQIAPLPRRQHRALLAALALRAGNVASTDRLVEDLWGEGAPASAVGSLQNAVSGLRKVLGRDLVVTQAPGYRLAVDPDAVDALRFEQLLENARASSESAKAELLREALALWHGPALADLAFEPFASAEIARLEELRLGAVEERIEADLDRGQHATLVPELETLVGQQPLRERLRGQLMLALYRCGRQAEALDVYRAARLALADELGLDPSPELQELERLVLRQDPSLAAPLETAAAPRLQAAERRLVTALAALPPADDDPEQHRLLLDRTLEAVQSALARNGGTLERFGPEGLLALFGADAPRDDDALRALATAEELGLPAGLATGEVVGGAGAVVNRAVELARSDGIALDERTQALVAATRRLDAPLVGREHELTRLRELFAEACSAGRCRIATVLGEPGIGKTRLARQLSVGLADRAEILIARCLAYGEGATFLPLLAALRRAEPGRVLAGEPDAELVVARLATLAGSNAETASLGESYWAVRRLLETLAQSRPIVLVLDDVHWAEPALLDLIDYLAERARVPLLVLCLARPELGRSLGETIRVGPLADEHCWLVVQATAELDAETHERIVGLAGGNALFAEQLAAYAAEEGEGLPPTLEAVLAGRLGQLDHEERAVLERAAVIGREFTRGAVAALLDGPMDVQLASLGRRGLVRATMDGEAGDDAYTFHHVLVRDAAYATLTKHERAALHERAAAWLDRDGSDDDALVGYHLEQAALYLRELGEENDELARVAGTRLGVAGMRVWRQNDARAATNLLRRATNLLPLGELRAELLCELAVALRVNDDEGSAVALRRAATDSRLVRSERLLRRVEVEEALHDLASGTSPPDAVRSAVHEAVTVFTASGDDRALGRAWLAARMAAVYACDHATQLTAARRSVDYYRRARFSPAMCFSAIADALVFGPTPLAAAAEECAALIEEAPDLRSEANVVGAIALIAAMEGRFDDVDELSARAVELYEAIGTHDALRWNRVLIERRRGDAEAAIRIAHAGAAQFRRLDEPAYESSYLCQLADALLAAERHDEAGEALERVQALAPAYDLYVQFHWRGLAGRLAAQRGRFAEGERLARAGVRLAARIDGPILRADTLLALAEVLALRGRASEAESVAHEAEALLLAKGDVVRAAQARQTTQLVRS